jgi:hypothetical protein
MRHFQIEEMFFVCFNRDSVRYNQKNSLVKSPEPTKVNFLFAISGSLL